MLAAKDHVKLPRSGFDIQVPCLLIECVAAAIESKGLDNNDEHILKYILGG